MTLQIFPKPYIQPECITRCNARRYIHKIPMDELYKEIHENYKKTTAYSLFNKQDPTYLSGKNSIWNRIKRWKDEKYIVIEQNRWEIFDKFFTFLLVIFTLILIIYAYQYDFTLVPKNLIQTNMNLIDQQNLQRYKNIQLTTDIIKGMSVMYIIILSSVRIFKRTTF